MAGPGRRSVLRAGMLMLATAAGTSPLSGCGLDVGAIRLDDDKPTPPPTPGPDELARRRAVESSLALMVACRAAEAARPDLQAVLGTVASQHGEHLVALGSRQPTAPPSTTTTSPGPVATDPVADLVAGHSAAASQALTDLADLPGPLAALLARIAACRAIMARTLAAALGQAPPPDPVAAPSSNAPDATGTTTALPLDDDARQALTAAAEGEHAAVYGYGVIAAHLADPQRQRAVEAIAAHGQTADQLAALLEAGGAQVPPAAPGYRLPSPVTDAASATALAARIEQSLAVLAVDLVAAGEGEVLSAAVDLLLQSAFAAVTWGGPATAFPGA